MEKFALQYIFLKICAQSGTKMLITIIFGNRQIINPTIFFYFCSVRNRLKATAILFSALLFFSSIITEKYCSILNSQFLSSGQENLSLNTPAGTPSLFVLNRNGERLVASIRNLPVDRSANQISDFQTTIQSTGLKKLIINSDYLQYSRTISRNLPNSDIIFPFHYFW